MSTTRAPSRPPAPSTNGTGPVVDLHPPRRRVRAPELAVGLLVTAVFALGAVLWHLSAVEKVPALVAATRIERGDVIEAGDVRVTYVASDDNLNRIDPSDVNRVVGNAALIDLAEGTLLTSSATALAAAVNAGEGVVGLSLDPGAYPARGLVPGDHVNVVRSSDIANLSSEPSVVARNATVFEVVDLSNDRLLVSVLSTQGDAEAVAALADAGGLRLVLVAP